MAKPGCLRKLQSDLVESFSKPKETKRKYNRRFHTLDCGDGEDTVDTEPIFLESEPKAESDTLDLEEDRLYLGPTIVVKHIQNSIPRGRLATSVSGVTKNARQ